MLPCPSSDPYTGLTFNNTANADGNGHMNCTTTTCDCRTRTVNLGLETGRTYEIAIFGAHRHPVESGLQLTMIGLESSRSSCAPRCGDGKVTGSERCDCGDASSTGSTDPSCAGLKNDGSYGGCTTQCQPGPYCGDAFLDAGREECDLGSASNTAAYGNRNGCGPGCRFPHFCGDANVDTGEGEQCDLGPSNGTAGSSCSTACRIVP
jgi:hypothetical protein